MRNKLRPICRSGERESMIACLACRHRTKKKLIQTQPEVEEEENVPLDEAPSSSIAETTATATVACHFPALTSAESYFLAKENSELKQRLERGENALTFQAVKLRDRLLYEYTGLPTKEHVTLLLRLLERFELKYFLGWTVQQIPLEDQLLCTLMKLRLNLTMFDLAYRFKTSSTTIQNIVTTIMYALHGILFEGMMDVIPSKEKNSLSLPACFISFPNCRIVLDCTEIEVAVPHSLDKQKAVFSNYKQRHTFKVLVGVAPNAVITYVSKLYPGSASDKNITSKCGILSHVVAGDLILADKGFLISEMCSELGVNVNIPPFLQTPQFTPQEISKTTRIARARIHVERAINRLKAFRILDHISTSMRPHATTVVQTCAALVNMQYSLLKENEQYYEA